MAEKITPDIGLAGMTGGLGGRGETEVTVLVACESVVSGVCGVWCVV